MVSNESPKRFSKLCVNCGKDIPLSRDTCPFCGAEQGQKPTTPQSLPPPPPSTPPSSKPEAPLNPPLQPSMGANEFNPNMMYCQTCGAHIAKTALACPKCGAPQPIAQPVEKSQTPTLGIISLVLAVIGFIVFGLFLGFFAIILGLMSLGQKDKTTSGTVLAILGIVLGLIDVVGALFYIAFL